MTNGDLWLWLWVWFAEKGRLVRFYCLPSPDGKQVSTRLKRMLDGKGKQIVQQERSSVVQLQLQRH
jgi:hypothetical protein